MEKRRLTLAGSYPNKQPFRAASRNTPAEPLLTIERAIADGLSPLSLRQVADANMNCGARRERQARNLLAVAERLELLGYRSAA